MSLDPLSKFKPRKVSDLERVAYHEAGHAYTYRYLNKRFIDVTIIPNGDTLGCVRGDLRSKVTSKDFEDPKKFYKVINKLVIGYAGNISDALFSGQIDDAGFRSDMQKIADLVTKYFPDKEERSAFQDWIWLNTFNMLRLETNWYYIDAIAKELLKRKRLTEDEVFDIIADSSRNMGSIDELNKPPGLIQIKEN